MKMKFLTREEVMNDLQKSFHFLMDKYNLDDIGIYEEQGPHDQYYMGYTINKNGATYMIHSTYKKNQNGLLAPANHEWTVETDEVNTDDLKGYKSLEDVFQQFS